jgi:ABC-type phosphate/phosphonate transport system permease subunit
METHTQEVTANKAVQTFYSVVAITCLGIIVIYPLAYLAMMYMATKLGA